MFENLMRRSLQWLDAVPPTTTVFLRFDRSLPTRARKFESRFMSHFAFRLLSRTSALLALALLTLVASAQEASPAADVKSEEAKPAEATAPAEATPEPAKPEEAKPADAKPEDEKPEEAKPEEKKPDEAKQEDEKKDDAAHPMADDVKAGHSFHAEVFNEGPRQKAYLMPGMPEIVFPITTTNPEAHKFFLQGLGQVHGFWYFEAERSFRQAAALDPKCAMAYWGMAMANVDNNSRAKKFMEQCVKHKEGLTERELMYIDALDAYFKADNGKKKERAEAYTRALEKILYKFPEDVEARALLALQLWKNRDSGLPIQSHLAIDALLDQVFKAQPMHPAHHYRIHLWDYERAENALASAALCGQSSAGVAHMWHMPGHIYSRLKRYDDAVFQQEASARVDHAHMMRDRVLPDQIHNFAHNNEWLIRNLIFIGRTSDALDLAKNMSELPRHPKYNSVSRGSSFFGRQRLFEVLTKYEMWDELLALSETQYLEPTKNDGEQLKRLRHVGQAAFRSGKTEKGLQILSDLRAQLDKEKKSKDEAIAAAEKKAVDEKKNEGDTKKAKEQAGKAFDTKINNLTKAVDEVEGYERWAAGDATKAHELLKKSGHVDPLVLAVVEFESGKRDEAIKAAQSQIDSRTNEVLPYMTSIQLLYKSDRKEDAKKQLEKLQTIAANIDLASPVAKRLEPIAQEFGFQADWRVPAVAKNDTGNRPALDSLGPFRWQPSAALSFNLKDVEGKPIALSDYTGKPVVLLFFLGHGCLHCAEQLHAFAALKQQYNDAGFELLAISSDDAEGLKISIENYKDGPLPVKLVSDPTNDTFKAYRCFDDFENQPLHGTFVIDATGNVRWQDIGFEPFMDGKFVLEEACRLLGKTVPEKPSTPEPAAATTSTEKPAETTAATPMETTATSVPAAN